MHKLTALLATLVALLASSPAMATRAKDIGAFYGVRDNQLTGAGLVVGLERTGDSQRNAASIRALANRLQGHGVSLEQSDIVTRNVALVMVSATLNADARAGSRIDVTVASTGDATSLHGGILLMTPLMGADQQVYAVAEGAVIVGGFAIGSGGDQAKKNTTTVGRGIGAALVEREVASATDLNALDEVEFVLRDADFTTAIRLADAIDLTLGTDAAEAISSSTVRIKVPEPYRGRFPLLAATVEMAEVSVDVPARVVVNERTGTVVMGADVRVSAVAVAHGGLTIEVRRDSSVSQPAPFSRGDTVVVSESRIDASEEDGKLSLVEGVDIGTLVGALNEMGVKPRDLMIILQSIKASGALHAEVVPL